jgi:hypothetical protein
MRDLRVTAGYRGSVLISEADRKKNRSVRATERERHRAPLPVCVSPGPASRSHLGPDQVSAPSPLPAGLQPTSLFLPPSASILIAPRQQPSAPGSAPAMSIYFQVLPVIALLARATIVNARNVSCASSSTNVFYNSHGRTPCSSFLSLSSGLER